MRAEKWSEQLVMAGRVKGGAGSGDQDGEQGLNIFADNCHKYWDIDLPVVPIKKGSKRPAINAWSIFQSQMPSAVEMRDWPREFADCGLGLPLGPQSRMFVLDVDTDDEDVLDLVRNLAPKTPWERRGKKGLAFGFRYTDQRVVRVRYRQAEDGKLNTLIDMLGAGSQVVLPPSIHPDTGKAYTETAKLWKVVDQLPLLPVDFEDRLVKGLKDLGWDIVEKGKGGGVGSGRSLEAVTNMVSVGARDNELVGLAGMYARDVMTGNLTVRQAVLQIEAKVNFFMEKTYGDEVEGGKGVAKLVEFLKKDMARTGRPLPIGWDEDLEVENLDELGLGKADIGEDDVVWTADQVRDWFMKEVSVPGVKEDPVAYMEICKEGVYKISRNPEMETIDQDALLKLFADMSGRMITLASVRKQLGRLRQGRIEGLSHAQIAFDAAERIEELSGEIRCWGEVLWQWTGSHWTKLEEGEVMQFVIQEYGDLKAGLRSSDHNGILKTLKNIRRKDLVGEGNADLRGINFVNGFLTVGMEMIEHDKDHGMTYCLPYPYDPGLEGRCGKFVGMLRKYWSQDEDYAQKVECLAEMMCLTMFGMMTTVEKAVCLFGVANSGKSRIIEILQSLLPPEVCATVTPDTWGERFSTIHLLGKMLNFAGELPEKGGIDGMKFKTIVSGEMISAEEKNTPKIEFRSKCAHWFSSNFLPKSNDSSQGFIRRWIILAFKHVIMDEDVIRDYEKQVVAEEREAIVAWAVSRMPGLMARGLVLTEPSSSVAQKLSLENELNSVRAFVWDYRNIGRLVIGADDHVRVFGVKKTMSVNPMDNCTPCDSLYHIYRSYCVAQAVTPVSSKTMLKRMEMLQGQFGFRCSHVDAPGGLMIQVYRDLTAVDPSKAKARGEGTALQVA